MTRHQITSPAEVEQFIYASNSTFTLVSSKTGTRFTFKLQRADGDEASRPWFVRVLTGSDNTSDYTYAGFIDPAKPYHIIKGRKGMDPKAPSMVALGWYLTKLWGHQHEAMGQVEFWHEGRCGACGRKLTVPASIAAGLGPDCAARMGVKLVTPKQEVPEDIAVKIAEQNIERAQERAAAMASLN